MPFEHLTFTEEQLYERERTDFDSSESTLEKTEMKQAKYCNPRRKGVHIEVRDEVLLETHVLKASRPNP